MELKTEKGYPLFEVTSALQKSIRRGLYEDALFWAIELETKFRAYLWQRLTIIAYEDVGPADPMVPMAIEQYRQSYEFLRTNAKRPAERLVLTNAILLLCMAKKTRLADDLCVVMYRRHEHEDLRLEVPDYALDKHTRRGRAMGRGNEHFLLEASKLVNEHNEIVNNYAEEATRLKDKYGPAKRRPNANKKKGEDLDLF